MLLPPTVLAYRSQHLSKGWKNEANRTSVWVSQSTGKNGTKHSRRGMGLATPAQTDLFRFSRDFNAAILLDSNANHVWVTADGTVFHVLLIDPRRWVDGDYDFLAASVAGIARVRVH